MSKALQTIDDAMKALSQTEAELEARMEGLNPVIQRSERALVSRELGSLRGEVRELERSRAEVCRREAALEPDAKELERLAKAVDTLRGLAGKGEKLETIVAAVGPAVGAARSVLGSM